jgi:hypothetical protein
LQLVRGATIGFGLLAACARNGSRSPASPGVPSDVPPRLVADTTFVLLYPAAAGTVQIQSNVVIALHVSAHGDVDTFQSKIDTSTAERANMSRNGFGAAVLASLPALHLRPARSGGRAHADTLVVRFAFRIVRCDSAVRHAGIRWGIDSTPPEIALSRCANTLVPHNQANTGDGRQMSPSNARLLRTAAQ